MRIDFTKMHGLGNDFIVFDAPAGASLPSTEQWRQLSARHTGVGFDARKGRPVLSAARAIIDAAFEFYRRPAISAANRSFPAPQS